MKSKLGLRIANCKLYQLLLSFGLASLPFFYYFTSHQIPFFFFFWVTLWVPFLHLSPNPFCLHFFCDKLSVFNKFYIGSSSFVMNNTYWNPNEEMVVMFGGHDSSTNAENSGEVHLVEATHVPIEDSYVSYFHMTNLRKQAITWKLHNWNSLTWVFF